MSSDFGAAQAVVAYLAAVSTHDAAEVTLWDIHRRLMAAGAAMMKPGVPRQFPEFNAFNINDENTAIKNTPDSCEVIAAMQSMTGARHALLATWRAIPDSTRPNVKAHRLLGG